MNETYKGIWPVMLTPFDERGGIDYDCYRKLIDWYISQGVDGIFAVCGSSEMFELDESERLKLAEIAVQRCKGHIPVVATGSIGSDIESHKNYSLKLADVGIDAIILLLPEFCSDESSTLDYLFRMAKVIPCDVGVYECPGIGIGQLSVDAVRTLARSGRFGPYKETSCEIAKILAKIEATRDTGMSVLQANTPLMLEALSAGGAGLMGIAVNVLPAVASEIYRSFCEADATGGVSNTNRISESTERNHQLLCLADSLLRLSYPASGKIILSMLGFDISETTRQHNNSVSEETRKLIEIGFSYIINQISSTTAHQ